MDTVMLRREGLSLALLGIYSLEVALVAAGWFSRSGVVFMGTTALCLILSFRLSAASPSIWPTIMVASHLIALACLWLGRPGDALVLAAWGAAHAPATIAVIQGVLLRTGTGRRLATRARTPQSRRRHGPED